MDVGPPEPRGEGRKENGHSDDPASSPTATVLGWIKTVPDMLASSAALGATSEDLDVLFEYHLNRLVGSDVPGEMAGPAVDCARAGCPRKIGPLSSQFHCPACQRTFCSSHAGHPSFRVVLAGSQWYRVCPECWAAQDHNQVRDGIQRNRMGDFRRLREAAMVRKQGERTTLEGRLTKLVRIREETGGGSEERRLQRRLVAWTGNTASLACSSCR